MASRRLIGLLVVAVVAAACSGTNDEAATPLPEPRTTNTAAIRSTTAPSSAPGPTSTSTTGVPPSTTTTVLTTTITTTTTTNAPTTTAPAPSPTPSTTTTSTTSAPPPEHLLITAVDGVYQLDGGSTTLLLDGNVAFATDDTRGGLLFQLDRGRNWNDESAWSTAVWWIPAGSADPRRLVVPAPGSGHELTLHDAYPSRDGFTVVYTRHEGTQPNVDMIDRLRSNDVSSGEIVDLYATGFESAMGWATVNTDIVALTVWGQVGSSCAFIDTRGNDLSLLGAPKMPECDHDCPVGCTISHDGTHLAFYQIRMTPSASVDIRLVATATGAEVQLLAVSHQPAQWGPAGLEVADHRVLLNRRWANVPFPALVLNLHTPADPPLELPMAGRAQWIDAPISITFPVPAREPGG